MAKLIFTYGAMNAGKTTSLLQVAHNYAECGYKALIFTYEGCDKNGMCHSRLGVEKPCVIYNKNFDFSKLDLENVSALLIDEAQFLTEEQVFELGRVASLKNIAVMCFGLRTSWQGHVFEGSSILLGISDELREIHTLCFCGKKANMAIRITEEVTDKDEDIGQNKYASVCRKCWFIDRDKKIKHER